MQDELRQTEAGEGGLDEVEADEHGQQQPPGADEMRQRDADEHEGAGEDADVGFGFHGKELDFYFVI